MSALNQQRLNHLRQFIDNRLSWDDGNALNTPSEPLSRSPVFVLCPPRSGSTLLRVMLAGHPQLFAPPELELLSFTHLGNRRRALSIRHADMLEGLKRALMSLKNCSAPEALALLSRFERANTQTPAFYEHLQTWCGPRTLVDKSTHYPLSPTILERAEAWFDAPRYIHLTRHPQPTMASFEKHRLDEVLFGSVRGFSPCELAEANWTISHANILDFLAKIPVQRQVRIRFEDLVHQPRSCLEDICVLLGIDFHPAMLRVYDDPNARMTDTTGATDPKLHTHDRVNATRADAWRNEAHLFRLGQHTSEIATRLRYWDCASGSGLPQDLFDASNLPDEALALWLSFLRDPRADSDISARVSIRNNLNPAIFALAHREVMQSDENLRRVLVEDHGIPRWRASAHDQIPNLQCIALNGSVAEPQRWLDEQVVQPLDPSTECLQSILVHTATDGGIWCLRAHRLAFDVATLDALIRRIVERYEQHRLQTTPPPLPKRRLALDNARLDVKSAPAPKALEPLPEPATFLIPGL
ncbi:MAG: hypothetical protein GVY22_01065, partial [Gammaproteobacteria bacterium]|nr:hypothetical protein [Gammaproteobacteria bacterium]